ncbi:helix-turn-helix transcriptional regulator [Halorussus salinisoli]|uniref:helix-turn-helix transcriptional regulator n=1 Tax=Halorussus salinisoli TaxID=2558242 RepID=UPI00148535E7|nr:MarR family transcriptional regulator [Halorussus salinisoli]
MNAAIDELAFLANSSNRVEILDALADAPRTRYDLLEQTEISRVTLGRILRELENRRWIVRRDREYRLTPLGEWICDEFTDVVEAVEAEHQLREAVRWLPSELVTFDVRCLRGAEVILLDGADMTKLERRILEFHRSGEWIRGFARGVSPEAVENHWELALYEGTRIEMVVTPDTLDALQNDPPSVQRFRDLLDHHRAHYLLYEDVPLSVGIVDDTVGITLTDERGIPQGGVATDNEAVYEWAVDLFETYWEKAEVIDPDLLTE